MSKNVSAPDSKEDIAKMVEQFASTVEHNAGESMPGAEVTQNAWAQRWTEAVSVMKERGFDEKESTPNA